MSPFAGRRPKISKLQSKGDRDGLIRALGHSDVVIDRARQPHDFGVDVRREAARALGALAPDAEVVGALAHALDDADYGVRLRAVHSLSELGDPAAAIPLANALAQWDDRDEIAPAARETLLELGGPGTARAYGLALLEFREPSTIGRFEEETFVGLLKLDTKDETAVRLVSDMLWLSRGSDDIPGVGLQMLSWLGHRAVEPLVRKLADPEAEVAAARALGVVRDAEAVDALLASLERGAPAVRRAAAWSLGEIRDPKAVEPLLTAANDPDAEVREHAAAALDKLGAVAVIVGVAAFIEHVLPHPDRLRAIETPLPRLEARSRSATAASQVEHDARRPRTVLQRILSRLAGDPN